jgi:hypothetical protein
VDQADGWFELVKSTESSNGRLTGEALSKRTWVACDLWSLACDLIEQRRLTPICPGWETNHLQTPNEEEWLGLKAQT